MKKNAKLAALAILVLAAVAALSVGITLAVVNARMPAACTCSGQCRSAGTETAAAGDAPSAQQTEPSEADSISIPGFDFLSLQAGAQEQSMPAGRSVHRPPHLQFRLRVCTAAGRRGALALRPACTGADRPAADAEPGPHGRGVQRGPQV